MFDTLFKRKRNVLTPLDVELRKRSQEFLTNLEKDRTLVSQEMKRYSVDPVEELESLGFSNSRNVREKSRFNKTVQTVLQSIQFINQIKSYFGEDTLVIKEEDMMYLIDKYDLVCGPFGKYLGHIPPEKICRIKEARNKINLFRTGGYYSGNYNEYDELYKHYRSNRLIYLKSIHYYGDIVKIKNDSIRIDLVRERILRFGMFLVPDDNVHTYNNIGGVREQGINYIEDTLGLLKGSINIGDIDLTHEKQHLFICAPSKDMDVDFSSKVVKYPDPLICSLGINNSVVVHTMWGPESEDSILDKYKS